MTHQAEFVLRLWHTDTNTIDEMNERWSDHAVVLPFTLSEMTLSQDRRFLAAYLAAPYGETEFGDSIVIISLEDGKSWFYDPWNKCEPLADARGSICYFTDDTGAILYYPSETLKP